MQHSEELLDQSVFRMHSNRGYVCEGHLIRMSTALLHKIMVNQRTNKNSFSFPKAEGTPFALGSPTCLNLTLPYFFVLLDWHSESSPTLIYCSPRNGSNYTLTCLCAYSNNHSRKHIFTIKPFQIQNTKWPHSSHAISW